MGSKVYTVCGPPGCGKSTWVARQSKRAAEKFGPERVIIVSLTRAAAAAVGSKDTGIPDTNVGTLHSICLRLIGGVKLISKGMMETWNREHPQWSISPDVIGTSSIKLDPGMDLLSEVYQTIDRKRHKLDEPFTSFEQEFLNAWTDWKAELGVYDFTQLIEDAYRLRKVPDPQPCLLYTSDAADEL